LSLFCLGIKEGDEVIMPTYLCSAVLNGVFFIKATPVLVDIDEETFNISPAEIEKKLTRKTKAIIAPHIYGVPADIDGIKRYGIPVIEDCAQAIGAEYKGKKTGTLTGLSVFSFYATKLLTTGYGGCIHTRSRRLIGRVKDFLEFDCRRNYYPRFNFSMSDINAALGISQLKHLSGFLKRREGIAARYMEVLDKKGIKIQGSLPFTRRIFYRFVIRDKNIKRIKKIFDSYNINTIIPITSWELLHSYLRLDRSRFPAAEKISGQTLSLPLYPTLTEPQINRVIMALKRI
jgi:perosamine synthetase